MNTETSTKPPGHVVEWTWYRITDGREVVIQTQRVTYRSHAAAFNASQATRHRGETYAHGKVACGCTRVS